MAKPRIELPSAAVLLALCDDQGRLFIRVTPGARIEELEIAGTAITAKVRAKPDDGKANIAVRDLLARALDLAPSRITLLRGATSREKVFAVSD